MKRGDLYPRAEEQYGEYMAEYECCGISFETEEELRRHRGDVHGAKEE